MNSLLSFAIYLALRSPCAIQCDSPIFRRVIEFLVFRIDVINTSQLSCIVELLAFLLPNTVFLFAEISLPTWPKFWPYVLGPGLCLIFFFWDGWAGAVRHAMWQECDEWHRTSGNNKLGKGSGRLFVIRWLNDGLDTNGVAGTVQLGAHGSKGHTDDLLHERMVAFSFSGPSSFLCCGHMANFFLLSLTAGPDCTAAHVHRLGHSREKDVPKLRDGNFDPSLLAPACQMGWWRLHASGLAILCQNPVVSDNRVRQPIHPVHFLVPQWWFW